MKIPAGAILVTNPSPAECDPLPSNLKEVQGALNSTTGRGQEKGHSSNDRIPVFHSFITGENGKCPIEAKRKAHSQQMRTEPRP